MYRKVIKRIFDIAISITVLIALALPMLIVSLFISLDSSGGVFFCQTRIGKNKQLFTMYKFRSMAINNMSDALIIPDENDSRITRVGAFLRKSSIDEIPQLWNIIKGEMSLIGPRPMLPVEYNEYKKIPNIEDRFLAKPGLFCTVDVEYRAQATVEQQIQYDSEYVHSCSFTEDIKCFFGVIKTVILQKNVYTITNKDNEKGKGLEYDSKYTST